MKKHFKACGIVAIVLLVAVGAMIPRMAVNAAKSTYYSKYKEQGKTKDELITKWGGLKPGASADGAFSNSAVTAGKYAVGTLKNETIENGINTWNYARWLAGLESIELSPDANDYMAKGALVNAANDKMSHYPVQPAGMNTELYNAGSSACQQANLFCGWSSQTYGYNNTLLMQKSVLGWLEDSNASNVAKVGHRRWMLNPKMITSGFGAAVNSETNWAYTACQTIGLTTDESRSAKKICWPSEGYFPIEFFEKKTSSQTPYNQAWSVSLDESYSRTNISDIVVTVEEEGGETETFNTTLTQGNKIFVVETGGYGTNMCIIFRPESLTPAVGKGYHVTISGLKTSSLAAAADIEYDVSFFTLSETPPVPVTGVTLDKVSETLNRGAVLTLAETIAPENATDKEISWTSSNPAVASVEDGTVTALSTGTATITVKTEDGNYTASCIITVVEPVTSVVLNKKTCTVVKGETETLTATILPEDATNKKVTWSSSNTAIATVNNGIITGIGGGTAVITVTTVDGSYTDRCTVTVVEPVTGVTLDKTSETLAVGAKTSLTKTVAPANAGNKNVSWSSSDTSIATVSDGVVTAISAGTVTITVTTQEGNYTADCKITVIVPVASVTLNKTASTLLIGEIETLIATVLPENAANKSVVWNSSNPAVATVNHGEVTALSGGTTTITVTTQDGNYIAKCEITVAVAVTGVKLDSSAKTLFVGEKESLVATVLPEDATNKEIIWSSDNTSVATVSNGVITAVNSGTAVITATTKDGDYAESCAVTVENAPVKKVPVTAVKLSMSSKVMTAGDSVILTVAVTPSNASDKSVTWFSSNTAVAAVSADGKVQAKAAGTAAITVKSNDGGKTAVFTVQVYDKAEALDIKAAGYSLDKITLIKGKTISLVSKAVPMTTLSGVIYESSNQSIVTVSPSGLIKGIKAGKANVTVKSKDGYAKQTVQITVVNKKVSNKKLTLSKSKITLKKKGDSAQILIKKLTAKTTEKVTFKVTSGKKLIKVDKYGSVTAKKAPTKKAKKAVVTVKCGKILKKFTVTLKK